MSKHFYFGGALVALLFIYPVSVEAVTTANVTSPFLYTFNASGKLQEAGSLSLSSSPYWWLNSGGYMILDGSSGNTNLGKLPATDLWRLAYAASSPTDTDDGYYPQNLFRLVTRSSWQNIREEVYLKILKNNLSQSTNRNASNGLLLMNRYQSGGDTLYYVGVRVDGAAVIKKKLKGKYYTLAYKKIISGTYDKATNPNLLPSDTWIGLRSEIVNNTNGSVTIRFYTDIGKTGVWKHALEVIDDGVSHGVAITSRGYAGVRTDFMDVSFDNFRLTAL